MNENIHVLSGLVDNLSLGLGLSLAGSVEIALELRVACVSGVEVTLQAVELATQTVDLTIESVDVILAVLVGAESDVTLAVATLEVIGDTSLELYSCVVSIHLAHVSVVAILEGSDVPVAIALHDTTVHVPNHCGLQAEGPSTALTKVEVQVSTCLGVPAVIVDTIRMIDLLAIDVDIGLVGTVESVQPTCTEYALELEEAGLALITHEEVRQVYSTKHTGQGVVDDVSALGSPVVGFLLPAGGVDGCFTLYPCSRGLIEHSPRGWSGGYPCSVRHT